jgi:hypothetical protein
MGTQLTSGIIIPQGGRIILEYSKASEYNEERWVDEFGNVTFQLVGHGWGAPAAGQPAKYHGHGSAYVVDASDPGGNGRHEAQTWANAVRDPMDPPSFPYLRSRVAFSHDRIDLLDSRLTKDNDAGKISEIYVDAEYNVKARPAQQIPPPPPIIGPNYLTAK